MLSSSKKADSSIISRGFYYIVLVRVIIQKSKVASSLLGRLMTRKLPDGVTQADSHANKLEHRHNLIIK